MLAEEGGGRVNSCPSQDVSRQDRKRKSLFQLGTSRLETCKNHPRKILEKKLIASEKSVGVCRLAMRTTLAAVGCPTIRHQHGLVAPRKALLPFHLELHELLI